MDKVFSYEALVHAIGGTIGGATVMSSFYPLEIVRTYIQVDERFHSKDSLQVARTLIDEDGLSSMYKGLGSTLLSLGCSNFIYFYTNNMLKVLLRSVTGRKDISTPMNLLVASIAGVVNVYLTCPLWVVNTRLKLQRTGDLKRRVQQQQQQLHSSSSTAATSDDGTNKAAVTAATDDDSHHLRGMWDGLVKIARKHGILELWSGCLASLVLVSNPTIQFVVYDKTRQLLVNYKGRSTTSKVILSSLEFFLLGAFAKAVATIVTYPIQLAQSHLRHGGHGSKGGASSAKKQQKQSRTILGVLFAILRNDGFFGWFKGLNVKLLQTILMAAFHFLCYEKIVYFIEGIMLHSRKHITH